MGIKTDKKSDKKATKPSKVDKKADKKATKVPPAKPVSAKDILAKAASKAKAVVKPPPKVESSDSSDSDESEDEKPAPKANGKAKKASVSSSEDSSEEDSEDEKPKAVQVKAVVKAPSSSDSDDSEGSSEDEGPSNLAAVAPKKVTPSKPVPKKAPTPSSSDDDSEDEEVAEVIKKPTTSAKQISSSSEEEDSSDDSSSEEAPVKAKVAAEESSDSDESDVEMEAPPVNANKGKRKAEDSAPAPPKKVKLANGDAVATEPTEEIKSIFVGSLDWNIDNDRLAQEFAECGEVISATVQVDRDSGRSRGFGYVHFATTEAVEAALLMNGKEIEGRAVNIDKSLPRNPNTAREKRAKTFGDTQSPPSSVLFVGNLSFNLGEDQLWETFGEHGDVKSVRVPTDRESGRPKGFAYVEFSDIESAKKAHGTLQGVELDGRMLRLDFSQPRDNSGGDRGGFGGGRGGGRGGRGGGRGGFGDRGGRGGGRGGRGGFGDRGGRGGGRGAPRGGRGGARTGGIANFEGRKTTF